MLVAFLFGAGALLGACTGLEPPNESDSGSDTVPECPIGSLNCLCTSAGTCDPGLVCASETCVPGDDETGEADTSTGDAPTTDIETSESGSPSTSSSACDPGGDGSADPACDEDRPYCLAGACVDCGGIDCAAVSPNLPVCDADSGLCAACDCDDANPVCDSESHTCGKCSDHSQCPDSACDLWTGGCMPIAGALWVDRAGACADDASGSREEPLCSLGAAFSRVQQAPEVAHAIRVRAGDYAAATPLRVPMGGTVAVIHATGGDDVSISAAAGALAVEAGGALLVDGIAIPDAGGDAVACASGKLWLDRLNVSAAGGHGVSADGCALKLRRSVLVGNFSSGARVTAAAAYVENSYISRNGVGNVDALGGVYLAGGASLDAVYATFISNSGTPGFPWSVACNNDPDDPAIEKVFVRNSVAINTGLKTLCQGATITTTAYSVKAGEEGATNLSIASDALDDYLTEDPALPGVYRAKKGTALDELAKWVDGDPDIDFDGDPRPSGNDSPDYAGADRIITQ